MKSNIYKCLVVLLALFSANIVQAQINIANTTPVTENFNSMNATLTLPTNWKIQGTASPTFSGGSGSVTQQASSGAPNTGGTYNFGSSTSERSVGAMTSGGFASPNSLMGWYRNTNSSAITQLSISYDLERYRINTAAASVQVYYSTNGSTWTPVTAGDISTGTIGSGSSSYNFASPTVFNPTTNPFTISGLNIPNGGDIYLRWNLNTTGSNSQGIGVDNISVTATFAPSAPTKLVISSISPASPTEGGAFNVTIQAQDPNSALSNVLSNTGFSLSNTNGGTIGGTTTGTITAGTNSVVVSGVTLSAAATNVTLTATRTSGDNLTAGTSATFTVLPAATPPTKFVITSISPASPTAGSGFDVTVQAQDNSNVAQNVTAATDFSLSTNGAAGTIGGTTSGTIAMGTNTFTVTGVTLSSGGTGATITATRTSGDNLTAGTSSAFTVLGAADHLTFAGVPSSGTSGVALTTFSVQARRADNTIDANYTGNITVSKASGPGSLSGTTTVAAVAGVATFSTLVFDAGGTYTLDASASGLTNATSSSINITQSPVTWNFTTASPSSGTPFANLTVSTMTVVNSNGSPAMLSSTSASSGYTGASGNNNAGASTVNGGLSVSGSSYFQFTLTPASGYYVALNDLSFGTRSTGTGPLTYALRSSKDNYATDIATGAITNNSNWALKTPAFSTVYSGTGSAITFRLYGYGGSGAVSGTVVWRIDDVTLDLSVQQCVTPSTSILSQSDVSCFGGSNGSATVSATGGPGYTYSWSPLGGAAATANNLLAGNYTCTVTNIAGGCSATQTVTIGQPSSAVSVQVSSQTNVSCNGGNDGSATVMASGGTPAYTYSWTPSGGTGATANGLITGNYTCTVIDANGCTIMQPVTLTEPTPITHTVSSQTNVSCNGGNDGSATVMANGGTGNLMYSWTPSGGQAATATGLSSGNYTCSITDNNGCVVTQTVAITEPAALLVSAGTNTSICLGASATLNASSTGGTGAVTYMWTPGNMTAATVTVSPTSATTYTLTGVDANGCTNMATVVIAVNNLPTVGASANPTTVCSGDPSTLTATGANTYSWNTGSTGASIQVAPTANTTYTVTGTDASGCVNTATVSVSVITCTGAAAEALSFDGSNDYISGTNSSLPQGIAARSFTAWIKPAQVNTTQTIFSYGGANANESSTVSITGGNLYYSSGSNDMSGTAVCAIAPNVWTHVAVTVNNKTVKFYINGAIRFTGNLATSPATSGTNWTISSSTAPFEGWMDEVSVWSAAITTQIAATMNQETASGQNGNIALYHFNQGFAGGSNTTTNTLTDASTTSSTGTLSGFALSGSSSNWVAPGRGGKTKLKDSYCGTTLTDINTQLLAELVSNATNYQWEFTDVATSSVYTYTRGNNQNNFYISSLPQLTFNKTYGVQVRAFVGGAWGTFGESCQITTPSGSGAQTQVQTSFCGTTLSSMGTQLFCNVMVNVTNYEWEFTDMGTSTVYTAMRGNNQNNFYLNMIPQLTYGKTYSVRVRAFYGGSWGTFGNACEITTPAFPTTQLQSVCGTTIASYYTQMFCTAVPNAQNYEYEFTDVNTSAVFTKLRGNNQNNLYLYMVPQAGVNKTYDVRVRAIVGGVAGPYGNVCTITTPATMARLAGDAYISEEELTVEKSVTGNESVWNFAVYPNPAVGTFYLESNVENAQVEIYDALGQQVSKEQITGDVHTIKMDETRKGMFYLRVISNNKILYNTKVINQ